MKISPVYLSLAAALVIAFLWSVRCAAIFAVTILAMSLSSESGFVDFGGFDWKYELLSFSGNLVKTSASAGVATWLTAIVYNFFVETGKAKLK